MNEYSIVVKNLSKSFKNIHAVKNISFQVEKGGCFGLLGSNGAGKSTTIKMMTSLLSIDSGEIEICSNNIKTQPLAIRKLIGYVPQSLSVDGTLTAYENLMLFSKLYGISKKYRKDRITQIVKMFDLEEVANRQVKTFSGGMVRRLEIGQAILHNPEVLFLDEPTVGLDPVARKNVWHHIEQLRTNYNMTIILTTHYMDEAESMCSNIAIMSQGEIVVNGTLAQLKEKIGNNDASMDDIYTHFAGNSQMKGELKDVTATRRMAQRLG
ncbi:multidrug ABC transporter ATP-binding protein [Anaerobacillus alkalidiazotrophicus]|uniref:Multidrug ABC transporter ATP-binding protein n=1 Tax=Anaerobacillus alkalidiazotrophicus TaxID=472963 RepID=A0A1S2M3M0_9BACI|nr:ATP-binding cassette domain-containing protein [Anaerobacillus alkalidiazotrophicus]OIJ19043.1 multidrug ABC transporter ATP-binding protein [Anaerobacillus alkalidiazotrophicus]